MLGNIEDRSMASFYIARNWGPVNAIRNGVKGPLPHIDTLPHLKS